MPDITMCTNDECPLRESCYRYMAKPSEYMQSYAVFEWKAGKKGKVDCEYYVKIKPKRV